MKKSKVLLVEPDQTPRLVEVRLTLKAMQEMVGGYIQAVYPWDDPVALVCNEEGKYNGQAPNRALTHNGIAYDTIHGPFFIAGIDRDDFVGIPDDLVLKYTEMFS